ncbi:MAG: glycosyltransferase family 4 protein [Gemmatimonadaceae bacterium]|nr:glycosyltransferase family 4 protein [Gemmatimonadaceae bacterium]
MTEQPLRILQVIETGGPGGAETVFARLSGSLAERGHAVQCLIRKGSWLPDELDRRGLPVSYITSRGAFDLALIRFIRELIREHRIQLVHGHLFDGALYAAIAARSLGIPSVVTLHGQVDVGRSGWRMAIKRALFARCVDRVVLVSRALQQELATSLPMPVVRQLILHNGVPIPDNLDAQDAVQLAARTRSSSDMARVVAIGNIRAPKNYPLLLQSIELVRRLIPNIHLDIVGEPDRGGLQQQLEREVAARDLQHAVTFRGFVPEPGELLRGADAFVLASSQEGFSLATIEAMLQGVPVVCSRSGGPEEIVSDGHTGRLVPVNDAEALANALIDTLRDRESAHQMAQRARRHAIEQFSLNTMVERYEHLYRSLV